NTSNSRIRHPEVPMLRRLSVTTVLVLTFLAAGSSAQTPAPPAAPRPLDGSWAGAFAYRALGPARQCGRVLHVAAHPSDRFTFYVSPGTGGLWRTTNNGTTFEPVLPDASNVPVG